MQMRYASRRKPVVAYVDAGGEGRNCEECRRASALLLFPGLKALPGPWLLLLAGTCTFVAIRALEMGPF